MSSSKSTSEQLLADIIKKIKPDKVLEAIANPSYIHLRMIKGDVEITVHDTIRALKFKTNDMELMLWHLKVTPEIVEFWYYRFQDLVVSRRITEV